VTVTDAEHKILQAFSPMARSLSRTELERITDLSNVPQLMRLLVTRYGGRFGPAVRRPGVKSNGGYLIRVLPLPRREE
jgi:hypothetical protein